MKLSVNPTNTSGAVSRVDRELHSALDQARQQLNRALQYLSSTNEGPSDPSSLRGRAQELEGRAQTLEHAVIDRMRRQEQTKLARLTDLIPQPPSIWHDLPPDLVDTHLFPFLPIEDLVRISEVSMGGVAARARTLLFETAHQLPRLVADHPLMQELMTGAGERSGISVGQHVLQLQNQLQRGLRRLHDTRARELIALYETISRNLSQSQKRFEQQALQLVKAALIGRLSEWLNLVLELRNDREIVLAAVQQNGFALYLASSALRNDRQIVLAAVQQNGVVLYHANEALCNDRQIVLAAVQQNGMALRYASDELRNDREIVLAAVQQSGFALYHASSALRNDREIVLAAVQQNGLALQYANPALRDDREIALTAVQQSGAVIKGSS